MDTGGGHVSDDRVDKGIADMAAIGPNDVVALGQSCLGLALRRILALRVDSTDPDHEERQPFAAFTDSM
jgi:hypothetical protein